MTPMDDDENLLRRYAATRSHDAFAALVARHTDLVWSSALRLVGNDPHRAEDVAQVVFAALAVKAPRLGPGVILPGWLLNATRFAAADLLKAERRRKRHERNAAMKTPDVHSGNTDPAPGGGADGVQTWARVAPVLDEALSQLSESLRLAVVLRFFERKSMRDVAGRLGISEVAARQRVGRGLEKLRDALGRKSVGVPLAALAAVLSGHAVQAAPPGVASTLASAASLASVAGTKGIAGAAGAGWLLGGWLKGSVAACVAAALLASVGVLIAWELAGPPPQETVSLAKPAQGPGEVRFTPRFPSVGPTGLAVVMPDGPDGAKQVRKDFPPGFRASGTPQRIVLKMSPRPGPPTTVPATNAPTVWPAAGANDVTRTRVAPPPAEVGRE